MKRRTALGLISAAASTPVLGTSVASAAQLELDTSNPEHTLMITRKLAHTMDDSTVFWWAKLRRMVIVDKIVTPMWDVWVSAILKTRDIDDRGGYETTAISMVFYTDLKTGEYMRTFKNPFTGKTVDISYFPARPSKRISTLEEPKAGPERPGYKVTANHPLGPAMIVGNDIWVRDDDSTQMEPLNPEAGSLFRVNDWSTYHGALSDVANPDIASAPATWHFNDILSFPPWLGMSDMPGDFVSRGFGRKANSFASMPNQLDALIKQRHPEIYQEPAAALVG